MHCAEKRHDGGTPFKKEDVTKMADEEKRLDQLLEKAKASGRLTIAEVQEASESLSIDPEQIMERCSAMQIELADDDLAADDIGDPAAEIANDEISNDDSVKIYLKEIGRVLWKELRVSLLVGGILGIVNGIRIYLMYYVFASNPDPNTFKYMLVVSVSPSRASPFSSR